MQNSFMPLTVCMLIVSFLTSCVYASHASEPHQNIDQLQVFLTKNERVKYNFQEGAEVVIRTRGNLKSMKGRLHIYDAAHIQLVDASHTTLVKVEDIRSIQRAAVHQNWNQEIIDYLLLFGAQGTVVQGIQILFPLLYIPQLWWIPVGFLGFWFALNQIKRIFKGVRIGRRKRIRLAASER
ncbi:MAG: hypothetical protein AAFU33_17315 [Bacteroidota bacterium]